jgi:hypothetical protein
MMYVSWRRSHASTDTDIQLFLIPAWVILVGFTACAVWATEAGIDDRHIWDMRVQNYSNALLVSQSVAEAEA